LTSFTPLSATLGGVLIGVSAVMLMASHGRIAGISGLFSGAVFGEPGDRSWRVFFLAGLLVGPLIYTLVVGARPTFEMGAGWPVMIAGGLLVGFGTRLGSGCTSGHGVCGVSRLSPRSVLATGAFMASGIVTVAIARHLLGA